MYFSALVGLALAIYALIVARHAHSRLDSQPRSFHFTVSKTDADHEKISFFVLYLSGAKVFFKQETSETVNISAKIDTSLDFKKGGSIVCESLGSTLKLQYITNKSSDAEQGEELALDLLSLPSTTKNKAMIENYFKKAGWGMKRAFSNDLHYIKENLDLYISYLS